MTDKLDAFGNKIAQGSIKDVAESRGEKPAAVLAECDVCVMLDLSSSMHGDKFYRATEALEEIQRTFPGRVALVEFSSDARLNLTGLPSSPSGMTYMHLALKMAKKLDGLGTKFYLISDGQPNGITSEQLLDIAREFEDPIHTIFIGNDWDVGGMEILKQISEATKGEHAGRIEPKMLGETIMGYLKEG